MNPLLFLKNALIKQPPLTSIAGAACLLLVGCTKNPSEINNTYLTRLSSTLNVPTAQITPLQQLALNPLANTSQPNITIGITELAGISQCNLNILISEHNNQLGKTATAATLLKYQIEFIQSAQSCLDTLDKQSNIYSKIHAATQQKQHALITYFNAMLLREPELNRTWQLSSQELPLAPAGYSDTLSALKQLTTIKNHIKNEQITTINSAHILAALGVLNKYKFNQQLIHSARTQIALNNSATQFVSTLNINEICPKGKNKQQAQIVSNIFNTFYLKQIQPYQAQLTGYLETLQPLYVQLWYAEPILTDNINALLNPDSNQNLLKQLKSSAKTHVTWWQKFYKTCEISPI